MTNSDTTIQSGERLSFSKLFIEKGYKVEIPIIQRDYAQGRKSKTEVRETFLQALYDYLDEGKPNRDLDFIYGSLKKTEETCFIPLDGQQRLTTLFLLHWYLANDSGNMPFLREFLATKDGDSYKSKFTYETRTSSREFCDELISNEIDLDNLLPPDEDEDNSLSKTIQDRGWYYLSWGNDPTIQSMLTMLDAIHSKFHGKPEFFDLLINNENPVITFLFLNLKDFKLTDDLYIKMNARGKPLTTFENFKAKFEQHIGNLSWKKSDQRTLAFGTEERMAYPKEYFSHKIDTSWANLLWNYRNVNDIDNTYDDELMNFIRIIMANEYALNTKSDKDQNLEFLIGTQVARKRKDYTDNLTYHMYERFGILTDSAVSYLINALDSLSNGEKEIHKYLSETFYFDEVETFKSVLKHDLTLPQRVQFHAYLKFLIFNKGVTNGIDQWMRVVHNLTENTVIDGADEVARATKSIEKLLPASNNILQYLTNSKNQIDFFLGRQVQEERIKAHLITKSDDWQDTIETIEKHAYFKGQILFLFEFSDILDYYEKHKHCDWSKDEDSVYLDRFTKYANNVAAVFKAIDPSSASIDYLWERAVLSKGDYLLNTSAWRKNLLSSSKNMRDYSWKRLLRLPPSSAKESDVNYWETKRCYIQEVFDDTDFDFKNLTRSLSKICKKLPDDWRKYFVSNAGLIRYCEQGFIRYKSEVDILLFKQSQLNHYHSEMYTYDLYLKELTDQNLFNPFSKCSYYAVKGGDDTACAYIHGWTYKKKRFEFNIYFDNEANKPFKVWFCKSRGTNEYENYPKDVRTSLESLKYKWMPKEGYLISAKTEKKAVNLIKKLCSELNIL